MTYSLTAGAHGVVIDSDILVCDLVRDLFLLLPAAFATDGMPAVSIGGLDLSRDAVTALRGEGLLTTQIRAASTLPAPPATQTDVTALDVPRGAIGLRHGLLFIAAGIEAAVRLAARRLAAPRPAADASAPGTPVVASASPQVVARELAILRAMRLVCPGVRRCLPRALLTRAYLRRRGIRLDLVLGVRTHPFDAHCWLQLGDLLVDDRLDHVRAYSPVVVL